MLKKAGIVAIAATAALLSVSPLAFAGESGHEGYHEGHSTTQTTNNNGQSSEGLVNVSDNSLAVPLQACNNDIPIQGGVGQAQVPVKDVTAALSGALAIFGKASSAVDQTTDNSRECGDNSGDAGSTNTQDS